MIRIAFDMRGMAQVPGRMRYVAVLLRSNGSLWLVDYSRSALELEHSIRSTRFEGGLLRVLSLRTAQLLAEGLEAETTAEGRAELVRCFVGVVPQHRNMSPAPAWREKERLRFRGAPQFKGATLPIARGALDGDSWEPYASNEYRLNTL